MTASKDEMLAIAISNQGGHAVDEAKCKDCGVFDADESVGDDGLCYDCRLDREDEVFLQDDWY